MDAETIDVTRVEVALRFRLATIAAYRSSVGGCNPWAITYGPWDNCLCAGSVLKKPAVQRHLQKTILGNLSERKEFHAAPLPDLPDDFWS
ncbi:hypothetical protein TNCV_892431 [Trichonephila clavipes]|nr:hypothetical protein TNCV_892431 [Trichonephila clavipes]